MKDVAWLMNYHVTKNGAEHYEIARKWLWDYCEHERKFSKIRVLFIMQCLIAVLDEMPGRDKTVVYVKGFLKNLMEKVTEFARMYDSKENNGDYDYHVLNPQMRDYVSISRT